MRSALIAALAISALASGASGQIDTNKATTIKGFVTLAPPTKLESGLLYYPLRFALKFSQPGGATSVTNRGIVSRVIRPTRPVIYTHLDFIASILAANNRQGVPASAYTLFCTVGTDGFRPPEGNFSKRIVLIGSPSPNVTEEFFIRTNQLRISPVGGSQVRLAGSNCLTSLNENVTAGTPRFETGFVPVQIVISNVFAAGGVLPYQHSESLKTFPGVGPTNCNITTYSGAVAGVLGLPN